MAAGGALGLAAVGLAAYLVSLGPPAGATVGPLLWIPLLLVGAGPALFGVTLLMAPPRTQSRTFACALAPKSSSPS